MTEKPVTAQLPHGTRIRGAAQEECAVTYRIDVCGAHGRSDKRKEGSRMIDMFLLWFLGGGLVSVALVLSSCVLASRDDQKEPAVVKQTSL